MYIEFISLNWHLFLALALILLLLVLEPVRTKMLGINSISPLRVPQVVNHDDGVIVDICETKEYKKGHIPDSISIPLSTLKKNVGKLDKYKDKPVVLSCRSGNRAKSAAMILRKHNFTNLHIITGGIMAWQKENLPVTTK